MGRLINIDELREAFRRDIMGGLNWDRILREAKPVDAVPVVRCKDCKHHHYQNCIPYCDRYYWGWKDDDFCSAGERKEGEQA